MKNLLMYLVILITFALGGCGTLEKGCDETNYESLSNERGDLIIISGGVIVKEYKDIKIIYSSSDTQAMWFESGGKTYYFQGDCILELK